jgi:tetratricopeptide (TPR) repeat protein
MDANQHYQNGLELKKKGTLDAALTEFRRAVIADAKLGPAHYEIGLICKDRSRLEPMFLRYAFDAFRQAARLEMANQDAHTQYIMLASKIGQIDELLKEYRALAAQFPDNAFLQACAKNILTISMTMMPANVNVSGTSASGAMRKMTLIASILCFVIGLAVIFGPMVTKKTGKLAPEHLRHLVILGLALNVGAIGGFFVYTRMK